LKAAVSHAAAQRRNEDTKKRLSSEGFAPLRENLSFTGHTRRALFDCLVVQVTMHAQHPKQGDKHSLANHAHEENCQSHAAAS
jgi:hypothetical protein